MTLQRSLRLLVVAAHPADAFDNAAGTLAMHARRQDEVHVVSVTHGARSHAPNVEGGPRHELDPAAERALLDRIAAAKRTEFAAAAAAVGVARTHWLGAEDEPYLLNRETIRTLAEICRETRPDILITHHPAERNHPDHSEVGQGALKAVSAAARWLEGSRREPFAIPTLYFFGPEDRRETTLLAAALRLPASHVIDIAPAIEQKKAALACFGTQKYLGAAYDTAEYIDRRIESLEGYWGLMNGPRYAEEFIAAQPHQLSALPTLRLAEQAEGLT